MPDEPSLPTPEVPSVDPTVLEAMREMLDDDEVVVDIVETFLQETPPHLRVLEQAASAGDAVAARAAAHLVKGGALTLGALRLGHLCEVVEASPDVPGARLVLREYDDVARQFQALVQQLGGTS